MSDKSKLGFNINPKNYDELNSTDNLITSGSDSGWLGKKLQGDDSNDLDLSKINPLFDKELYERYRPGVNTNDGSVNQDIWGYKCFNSPVSFRNGIYGDTYSIKSIEGIESDALGKSTYIGVSTAVNDKNSSDDNTLDNVHYSFNNTTEALTITAKSNIASTYTGKLRRSLNATVRPTYDLFEKEPRVYGSSIENETSVIGDIITDCFWLYTYCNPDKTKLNIYNGINVYSSNSPTQYINERNEINIASTIFNDDNTGTTQDIEHTYSESRVTVGTNCKEDIVIKDYTSAAGNCIRMYSTNGRYRNAEYINDNISSIIITPEIINTSVDNKIITIDYHTDKLTGDDYNYSKPVIDIAFDYTKATDDPANLILFQMASLLNIQDATVSDAEDAVPSINVHGIFKNGNDDIIKYRGTRITPTSIAVNAIQFNRFIMGDTFISNTHNKLVPVEYIFKQNDTDETGINTYGLKLLSCDGKLKTSFICDYLVVNESIKYKSTVSYTDRLVYIDPETNNTTNVLTVQSNNLILPRENGAINIGDKDNRLGTIYASSFNGKATSAVSADTANRAIHDYYGNDIRSTYVIKNLNTSNDIQSYNAIIGSGERLFFFNEPCIENSIESPEDIPKPHVSIGTTYENNGVTSKNVFSWTNKNNTITQKCTISSRFSYDEGGQYGATNFYVYPEASSNNLFSSHIGKSNSPWDYIYCNTLNCSTLICKNFPTITGDKNKTSVGNIRLLAIQSPYIPDTDIYKTIGHGSEIQSPIMIDGKEFTIYIARLSTVVENNASIIKLMIDVESGVVEGKWRLLSSVYITNNRAGIMYTPVLAMRVE